MAHDVQPMDISDVPELLQLAEEVHRTNEPRILRRADEDLAIVLPVSAASRHRRNKGKSRADYEAFRAAAGSWSDVDTDKLIEEIYETRRRSMRQPIDL